MKHLHPTSPRRNEVRNQGRTCEGSPTTDERIVREYRVAEQIMTEYLGKRPYRWQVYRKLYAERVEVLQRLGKVS
jgi:hypothetical protein